MGGVAYYAPLFSIELSFVESPTDAKEQFGEIKIVDIEEESNTRYRYEDDWIDITWCVLYGKLDFQLRNKSNHTLRVNWDDISFVNIDGKAGKCVHLAEYMDEPYINLPRGAMIHDVLIPPDGKYYSSKQGGWIVPDNRGRWFRTVEELNAFLDIYVGKTMSVMLPIYIENVRNDYMFVFLIRTQNDADLF